MGRKSKSLDREGAYTVTLGGERKEKVDVYRAKMLIKGTRLNTIPETLIAMIDRALKAESL